MRRLEAHRAGQPLPSGVTRTTHVADADDVLILAFVRMGGESRPWGVVWGHPGGTPEVRVAPDGRHRASVAAMLLELAAPLRRHLGLVDGDDPDDDPDVFRLPQVWLPNASHLEMAHLIAIAHVFARAGGDDAPRLNALGRTCGWLFREAERPGQQAVVVATAALRDAYAFPAQDSRQGHLGFLLAWLDTPGDRAAREAAATLAERSSIGTSLDPRLERELEALMRRASEASRRGDSAAVEPGARSEAPAEVPEVRARLEEELLRRFDATARAWRVLRTDPRRENAGLQLLIEDSFDALQRFGSDEVDIRYALETGDALPYIESPVTDGDPAAAASRYHEHAASAAKRISALVHDDPDLQAELIAAGEGFRGMITETGEFVDGRGRPRRALTIEVADAGPMKTREQDRMTIIGLIGSQWRVKAFEELDGGGRRVHVQHGGGGKGELQLVTGATVTLVADVMASLLARKVFLTIGAKEGRGAWLTHGRAPHDGEHEPDRLPTTLAGSGVDAP